MPAADSQRLRSIRTLPQLVAYLRDELDWPIATDDFEEAFFDFEPEEIGLDEEHAAKIKYIKQLRPLHAKQPWGVFFVEFEKKKLPVAVLRRILSHLVVKKRAKASKSQAASWHADDLFFVSAFGEAIRNHYNFLRAADADMALWVLHYMCFTNPRQNGEIKKHFDQDPFMLKIRAKNLVAPLSELTLSRLAQALATVRDDLAGLVGAYSFESAIREKAALEGAAQTAKDDRGRTFDHDLEGIINALRSGKSIDSLTAAKWHRLRLIRNKVIHGKVSAPSSAEIRDLIEEVLAIEQGNVARA